MVLPISFIIKKKLLGGRRSQRSAKAIDYSVVARAGIDGSAAMMRCLPVLRAHVKHDDNFPSKNASKSLLLDKKAPSTRLPLLCGAVKMVGTMENTLWFFSF